MLVLFEEVSSPPIGVPPVPSKVLTSPIHSLVARSIVSAAVLCFTLFVFYKSLRADVSNPKDDRGGATVLMRNDQKTGHHWIQLKLIGTSSNRDAIGARVELISAKGLQVREVQRSNSYLSQNDVRVHFGLGIAGEVDSLKIHWPSGQVQTIDSVPVDRITTVTEPAR